MADVTSAQSRIHGIGIFATRDFADGEIILPIDDSRIVDEEHPLCAELGEYEYNCDYLAANKMVLMRPPERYINSSCDPNSYVKTINGIRYVVARRDIKPGEEITYDYMINFYGGEGWQCDCHSAFCRRLMTTGFFDLPLARQLEYLPLLDDWFVEEHREKVEVLRTGLADR